MEEQEEVTFDIGGPIGPIPQSVSNLNSFVGTIGRNKRFVTLLYTSWHAVPQHKKRFMWRYVNEVSQRNKKNKEQQKFPHRMGPVNFARVRAALDSDKGVITFEILKRNSALLSLEFCVLMFRLSPKLMEGSKLWLDHRESKGTNEEPKRFEVFIATRTSRKRKELDEGTQSAIEIFQSRQASGATEEEAF
ncbi:hypothetical protein PIB30_076896 [Stylosanthes scabra]|uniref:Uncharacterized protein n=1 Tax=Stylosanthes scabra TaxID=79078 RepID=A0ABU6VSB4_9FABA|nr:hypothetical protein [Stylosanthes scabra]